LVLPELSYWYSPSLTPTSASPPLTRVGLFGTSCLLLEDGVLPAYIGLLLFHVVVVKLSLWLLLIPLPFFSSSPPQVPTALKPRPCSALSTRCPAITATTTRCFMSIEIVQRLDPSWEGK
jgi:hypothetical protein